MGTNQNRQLLIQRAERAYILIVLLTAVDVVTTIIAKNMGFHESNPYVLLLMYRVGFSLGLLIYFIIIVSASYVFLSHYQRYVNESSLFFRVVNAIGFCGLWGLAISRFMPLFNNTSYIVGFYILPPSLLKLHYFLIIGFIYGSLNLRT